jgi:hypothetical protein
MTSYHIGSQVQPGVVVDSHRIAIELVVWFSDEPNWTTRPEVTSFARRAVVGLAPELGHIDAGSRQASVARTYQ